MKKILSFFWRSRLFFVIIFVSLLVVVYLLLPERKEPVETVPTKQGVSWQSLTPGVSGKNQVIEKLGNPIEETKEEDQSILDFRSSSSTRNHQAVFENETANFLREIVTLKDEKTTEDLKEMYGETENVLYGPDAYNGYYLFVYPEKGVAYLGSPGTGNLLEIWYFPPTNMEDFTSVWAQGYSTQLKPQF